MTCLLWMRSINIALFLINFVYCSDNSPDSHLPTVNHNPADKEQQHSIDDIYLYLSLFISPFSFIFFLNLSESIN